MSNAAAASWYRVTISIPGQIPAGIAVEARDEAHARRRVAKSVAATPGAVVTECSEMTLAGWAFVDRQFPLPGR